MVAMKYAKNSVNYFAKVTKARKNDRVHYFDVPLSSYIIRTEPFMKHP